MKIRIKKLPKKAYGGQQSAGALDVTPNSWGGMSMYDKASQGKEVKKSLTSVPRSKANLEAEGGETAFGPISGDTIPDHFNIEGPRHSNGGVPLSLPDDTFIFSDTKSMRITDPKILKIFGKGKKKGGYTPAELAKPYDINKYKAILADPDSDRMDRENAELMIKNYIMKLGALAIAQESKKGFPQGIPEMARPYMEANGITDEDLLPEKRQESMAQEGQMPQEGMVQHGGTPEYPHGGFHDAFGDLEKRMQERGNSEITLSSPEEVLGASDAKAGIFSPDNPYTNPLTGQRQAFMTDSKTGDYAMVKQPEKSEDKTITMEQKINDAFDINLEAAADQGKRIAAGIINVGDAYQDSQRMKDIYQNALTRDSREDVVQGINLANEPGESFSNRRTSVQSYMSEYGGPVSMAEYGITMGGAYYPTMATGGTARVRIKSLPIFDNGGPTIEGAKPVPADVYDKSGYKEYTDAATGEKFKYDKSGKKIVQQYRQGTRKFQGTDEEYLDRIACDKIKASGMTVEEFIKNHPTRLWDYDNPKFNAYLKKCESLNEDKIRKEPEQKDDPKDCGCPEVDANGNVVKNADGTTKLVPTGEQATYNEETKKWDCPPCDYNESFAQEDMLIDDPELIPQWSDTATRNVLTQALMRTKAAKVSPPQIDTTEFSPVLQRRYTQDIDAAQAGMRRNLESRGLTTPQLLALNLTGFAKGTREAGMRQKQTEDYNKNVLNTAAQFNIGNKFKTDATNQNIAFRAALANQVAEDKDTAGSNQRLQNLNRAAIDADREMQQIATWNIKNRNYPITFKEGLPTRRITYRDPNPTKSTDILEQYKKNIGDLGVGNEAIAYKLARDQVYGASKFGGSVKSNDFIPRYTTMPYGK